VSNLLVSHSFPYRSSLSDHSKQSRIHSQLQLPIPTNYYLLLNFNLALLKIPRVGSIHTIPISDLPSKYVPPVVHLGHVVWRPFADHVFFYIHIELTFFDARYQRSTKYHNAPPPPPQFIPTPPKKKLTPKMPSRTENSDRALANSRRWRLNSSGQLVDTEADVAAWEIVDEMNRINLNDGTPDTEDVRLPIRTPPKSKLPASTVAHINEVSPLDSSSSTSIGSSPNVPEHPISHSRGSSADTTTSSARDSVAGNPLLAHPPLKVAPVEAKERPHSFSGGLSTADLRRLQQVGDSDHDRQLQQHQWAQNQYREANMEQLSYPSLANQVHRPAPQQPMFNYPPPTLQAQQRSDSEREATQIDYGHQQQLRRNFNQVNHGPGINASTPPPPQFVQGRPNNASQAINYRQNVRGFPPGPSPTALVYPGSHHTSHLSLGNTQQLYEMMLPGPPPHDNPAVTRVQQQHNIFRATHHHSASDPSAIRDAATLALLNTNMQNFAPGMFQHGMPTMPLYPNQYYGAQDLAVQQAIAARIQSQYSAPYNVAVAQNLPGETGIGSPTSSSGQTGPSANNRKLGLYKTELCRSWEEKGTCRYGTKCQFAHGEDELRTVSRHPKVGDFAS